MSPATPAAASRCPMLVLTEPSRSASSGARPAPSTARERVDLDRIAQRRAGAVRLHVGDLVRRDAGVGQRLADHRLLRGAARRGEAAAAAVLVHRAAADHGEHAVAVGLRVGQALEHDHPATLAAHVAVRRRVERLAAAVGREHARLEKAFDVFSGERIRLTPPASAMPALAARAGSGRPGARRPATTSTRCRR